MTVRRLLIIILSLWIGGCQNQSGLPLGEQGKMLFREGKYDEAIAMCTQAIALNADDADAYTTRGRAYLIKGDTQQAIKEYNAAIAIAPKDPEAYYNRAVAYKTLGDMKRWGEDEKQARQLDPLYAQAYLFTPHDENELEARVLAATAESTTTPPDEEAASIADQITSAPADELEATRSSAAEAISRLSSQADTASDVPARRKKSISESLPDFADPLGLNPEAAKSGNTLDPFALPSLGSKSPHETSFSDPLGLDRAATAPSLRRSRDRREQAPSGHLPEVDMSREESRVSRRQIRQDINAGEINARRLENRAYNMQFEGNTGYTASPFSGLTDSAFPQPKRASTGLQDSFGSGSGIGAKAGQGPLNPYGSPRSSTPYSPTVPQPSYPDSRNFSPVSPSGPISDFYFSP